MIVNISRWTSLSLTWTSPTIGIGEQVVVKLQCFPVCSLLQSHGEFQNNSVTQKWVDLCPGLMTPGLSKDIWCHV